MSRLPSLLSSRRLHNASHWHPAGFEHTAMNNFSFLDTSSNNMPRQAPSPAAPTSSTPAAAAAAAAQHQANGVGMGGPAGNNNINNNNNNNNIPMINGLPSGGQQSDMNYLWNMVQQLGQVLDENRAQTAGIVSGVQAIQARAAEEGGPSLNMGEANGELNGEQPSFDLAGFCAP